jgi:polysaccharide biosynthesis transport protein
MNAAQAPLLPGDVARTITKHPLRLIVPVVGLTLVAFVYAGLRQPTWEAAQALVVRDEAGDRLTRPGQFAHTDEMKTSQETILELVKSRNVLSRALVDVAPPADRDPALSWPSDADVEALQAKVKLTPPKGAEFGKTEVFYLKVQDTSHNRAVALAAAVCGQLQHRFSELRESKAKSTIDELTRSVELAQNDLTAATRALSDIEKAVGSDLAELRILNESPSGDGDLRRMATDLEKELRTARAAQAESQEFLKLLAEAKTDPGKLVASPSVFLKSQPALGRLKDGLVDAQLRTGQLLGTMDENHPLVRGARAAEQAIRGQLHDEIGAAMQGIDMDLTINQQRIQTLQQQEAALGERFGRLAAVRAEYANLVTATKNRSETLKSVEHELAEARASQHAARSASLISLIDSPDAGTHPAGPSRAIIVLGGIVGGLAIGLAISLFGAELGIEGRLQKQRARHGGPAGGQRSTRLANLKRAWRRVAKVRVYSASASN